MMITVIIPTFNRASLLEQTILSITRQQSAVPFEIIVVDNGSLDTTRERTLLLQQQFPVIQYVQENKPGLHEGRHRGMREASYEILAFIDDDILAEPEWLNGIAEAFQDNKVALVGGNDLPNYESSPPSWLDRLWFDTPDGRYMTYFSLLEFGDHVREIHPHFVFGCNFSIRKSVLKTIGGFHPDAMPGNMLKFRGDGETHVAQQVTALGYKTLFHPKVSVKHWVPASRMNKDYLKKRAFAEGITQSFVDARSKKVQAARWISTLRKFMREQLTPNTDPLTRELKKAFDEGYKFHQTEMKKDRTLQEWVHKSDYLS